MKKTYYIILRNGRVKGLDCENTLYGSDVTIFKTYESARNAIRRTKRWAGVDDKTIDGYRIERAFVEDEIGNK